MNADEGIGKNSWETEQRSIKYGKFFWHVGLPGKGDAKIFIWSSRAEIGSGGGLLMYDPEGSVNLALAPGEWKYVYTASVFDGHPVAVEDWPKTKAIRFARKERLIMNKQSVQTKDRYAIRDLGMDTLTKERIRKDASERTYLDYGNIVDDVSFRVRLYIGQDLLHELEKTANLRKPRMSRSPLNNRGEPHERN